MIFSIDSAIGLAIAALVAASFLGALDNFDFSIKEIAVQRFTDDVALALQEEATSLELLANGDDSKMAGQLSSISTDYCIEVTANQYQYGECSGQNVNRRFVVISNGQLIEARVATYFE